MHYGKYIPCKSISFVHTMNAWTKLTMVQKGLVATLGHCNHSINVYLSSGLDVGPPVQEDLDGLRVALVSSIKESSGPTL